MATNQTEHYALNQWQLSDSVVMADFNADNQKVDAALAALTRHVDTAIADLNSRVDTAIADANQKITAAQNAATQKINAAANTAANDLETAIAAIAQTIPRVQTGSYVGTGTYGEENPNTLTFDFTPKVVIISNDAFAPLGSTYNRYTNRFTAIYGSSHCPADISYMEQSLVTLHLAWGECSLSWYTTVGGNAQANQNGITYHYIAIG